MIVFDSLSRDTLARIVRLQIDSVNLRLGENSITLSVSDPLLYAIVEKGYDPRYGARPLKRTIQRMILDPLAKMMLEENIREKMSISASWEDGQVRFESRKFL